MIKVIPASSPLKHPGGLCQQVTVPTADTTAGVGVSNSDLHLYVTWTNEPTSSFLAWAGACILSPAPRFG